MVTATLPDPPPDPTDALSGASVAVQATAAWLTVYVCPPTVMVPVRPVTLGLAATLNPTAPLPDPLAPDVIEIHGVAVVAVQAQPLSDVTLIVPVAAVAGADMLVGEIEYVQDWPVWVTLKACPPIVIAPVRELVAEFAVTLYPT
jgi:hypothetical protein